MCEIFKEILVEDLICNHFISKTAKKTKMEECCAADVRCKSDLDLQPAQKFDHRNFLICYRVT